MLLFEQIVTKPFDLQNNSLKEHFFKNNVRKWKWKSLSHVWFFVTP